MLSDYTTKYYPTQLKSLPNWVLWRLEDVEGRQTKVPYSALYHGKASSTNPKTWTTYENAVEYYNTHMDEYDGIAFVFTEESRLVFIDIDHCLDENGVLSELAKAVLNTFKRPTFYELSQSGTGLHIVAEGTIPKSFKNSRLGIEMYNKGRFCAMTGNVFKIFDVTECQDAIDTIYETYKTKKSVKKHSSLYYSENTSTSSLSDSEVISKASSNEVTGCQFRRLYDGYLTDYNSHSECDLRLCQLLAYWCDRDGTQVDRIFRSSGLCRLKWLNREDYRTETIQKACDYVSESYSEYVTRKRQEELNDLREYILLDEGNQ